MTPSTVSPFRVFGTGLDNSGRPLAGGAADPHYSITSGPTTTPPVMMPQGGFPFPYWTGDTISGWITPGDALTHAGDGYQEAEGDYVYETTFDLTGYDASTAVITGLIGADNRVAKVQLNGVDVPGYTPTDASSSDFSSLRTLLITSGFMPGSNKLDFTVHNDPGTSWNPTGFRAQLNGTAQLTGTAFAVFGTGVDDGGNLLADGVPDPHYQLIAAPAPDATGAPFVTIQNGYPYPYWTGDGPNSKWISPEANENDMAGGATDPVGDYTYETTFDLTGFDPTTARIAGYVSADNTLEKVLLNGQDIGYPSSGTNDYTDLHPLVIDSGFKVGVNKLDFVVYNAPQTDGSNAHNPSAFRAELSGTAATVLHAFDDSYTTLRDQPLTVVASGVLSNDSAPAGQSLTAEVLSAPQHGTLTLQSDGSLVYSPSAGYVGTDSFTYDAVANGQHSNAATVTLNVDDWVALAWTNSEQDGTSLFTYRIPLVNGSVTPVLYDTYTGALGGTSLAVNWGDGDATADGSAPHFFTEGEYTVTLIADENGQETTTTFGVNVTPIQDPIPPASCVADQATLLDWNAVDGAINYDIYRGVDGAPPADFEYLTSVPTPGYLDDSANAATAYDYQIVANLSDGTTLPLPPIAGSSSSNSAAGPISGQAEALVAAGPPVTPALVTLLGTATMQDADALFSVQMQKGRAETPPGSVFVGIYNMVVTGVDVKIKDVLTHTATAESKVSYIKGVKKDDAGKPYAIGGYAAAKDALNDIAKVQGAPVTDLGNGKLTTTLQDGASVTLTKDGDWGAETVATASGLLVNIQVRNPIQELAVRGPGGVNNSIDWINTALDMMVEEKDGTGLIKAVNLNPDGTKRFTEAEWAEKHIFNKMKARLDAIKIATETYKHDANYVGPDALPTADDVRTIKNVMFLVKGNWPELKNAVNAQVANLRTAYPDYTFFVEFDGS